MKDSLTITVTDPKSGRSITWQSSNKTAAINQARIEVQAGAQVEIRDSLGRIVWSG